MKKLGLILMICVFSILVRGQVAADFSFFTSGIDSITILPSSAVYGISIYVPSDATDSTLVYGSAKTIGDQVASCVKIAPGDPAWNIGDGEHVIRYLYIIVRNKCVYGTMRPVKL